MVNIQKGELHTYSAWSAIVLSRLAAEGIALGDGEAWGKLDDKQQARVLEVILNTIHGDLLKAYKADLSDDLPADEATTSITNNNILPLHFLSWYRLSHDEFQLTQGPLIQQTDDEHRGGDAIGSIGVQDA